ncbi:MAG: DMT family transporter [Anaerolineales bacterium]|nr:DMT family transporter [Anaerolineales bacterium]
MKTDPYPRIPPPVAVVIGILAASTSSILIRFAQTDASSLVIAAYRLCFASLILVPFMLRQPRAAWPAGKRVWWLGMLSGFFLAAHFVTWISSLEYTSVASSVVLVQTAPLFVAILSPLFLKEAPSPRVWLGLVIAFTGGILIAFGDSCSLQNGVACPPLSELLDGSALQGDALALIGGFAGAAYLMIGRDLRSRLDLVPYVSIVYGSAAIMLLTWAILSGEQLLGYRWVTYGWFLLLALFPQLLAHTTYNWALKYMPATSVSLSLLGEPISAAILAWVLLNETIPFLRILGGIVVLAGILLAVFRAPRRATQSPIRE